MARKRNKSPKKKGKQGFSHNLSKQLRRIEVQPTSTTMSKPAPVTPTQDSPLKPLDFGEEQATEYKRQIKNLQEQLQQKERECAQQQEELAYLEQRLQTLVEEKKEKKSKLQVLQKQLSQAQKDLQKSEERAQRFLTEREEFKTQVKQAQPPPQALSVQEALQCIGIPKTYHQKTLEGFLQSEQIRALDSLKVDDNWEEALKKSVQFSCDHPICVEEARHRSSRKIIQVEDESICEYCEGSANKRMLSKMGRLCRSYRKYNILIVGGTPNAHSELKALQPSGITLRMVSGVEQRNKQQANEDIKGADLIVIWGPTILSHKISELYTKQKTLQAKSKILTVHKRGIASLAESICAFIGPKED